MVISEYQINNVLRVYGDQLRQSRLSARPKNRDTHLSDKIDISAEAKKRVILDKVAANIVDKITHSGVQYNQDNIEKEVSKEMENEYGMHLPLNGKNPTDLLFKVIDENGETINSFSIEDSEFSRYRLGEDNEETVNEKMM